MISCPERVASYFMVAARPVRLKCTHNELAQARLRNPAEPVSYGHTHNELEREKLPPATASGTQGAVVDALSRVAVG